MEKRCEKCVFASNPLMEEPCWSCDDPLPNFQLAKSQEVSAVLKLMDNDYTFGQAVDVVVIIFEVDRNQLLEELNYFI